MPCCGTATETLRFANQRRLSDWRRPIRKPPHSGAALEASGELASATEETRRAIALEPNRAELHDDLGSLLTQQGLTSEAIREFAAALELQPTLGTAHFHMGALRYTKNPSTRR